MVIYYICELAYKGRLVPALAECIGEEAPGYRANRSWHRVTKTNIKTNIKTQSSAHDPKLRDIQARFPISVSSSTCLSIYLHCSLLGLRIPRSHLHA